MDESKDPHSTILVVEDFEDTLLAMRLALEDQGYRIIEASDGRQAVEVAARERPDIILMDLRLPVLDGISATRLVRENPELKDVIIVAVTADQDPENRAQALAAGCNAFVSKPIDFDWLNDLLGKLLA